MSFEFSMPNRPHYVALWKFDVKPDSISAFEEIYGTSGSWAQLFRQSPDYLGTQLVRDVDHPNCYLTLDRWTSREAFQRFKEDHHLAYATLDKQCETLTEQEAFVADFEDRPPSSA